MNTIHAMIISTLLFAAPISWCAEPNQESQLSNQTIQKETSDNLIAFFRAKLIRSTHQHKDLFLQSLNNNDALDEVHQQAQAFRDIIEQCDSLNVTKIDFDKLYREWDALRPDKMSPLWNNTAFIAAMSIADNSLSECKPPSLDE